MSYLFHMRINLSGQTE